MNPEGITLNILIMKKLISILFVFFSFVSYSQKLDSYKASNGITYKVGDDIMMGAGSGKSDNYVYMWVTGVVGKGTEISSRAYNGYKVTIKKMKHFKDGKDEKVLFLVGGGNITNYTLDIENAIASCEIKDCNDKKVNSIPVSSKYDELKKLKELFDSGALTEEEYKAEKEKLLK